MGIIYNTLTVISTLLPGRGTVRFTNKGSGGV